VEKLKHKFAAINNNVMYRQSKSLQFYVLESNLSSIYAKIIVI